MDVLLASHYDDSRCKKKLPDPCAIKAFGRYTGFTQLGEDSGSYTLKFELDDIEVDEIWLED